MNSVFIHTFDKSGALHVRILFSVAGATLHVYPLGVLQCAPPSGSLRAAQPGPLQIESYCSSSAAWPDPCSSRSAFQSERCPARALQFESCWSVRELLRSSRAAFAVGATRHRSDVRPLGSLLCTVFSDIAMHA